ncbi:MAG: carboxypeptidase-like regulatory domain-containing protein, partial [Acidobacteria bacterium]|nr:carboxypeptidase-like regulatory domain-containing protein [Acidobacteriota bacterium]
MNDRNVCTDGDSSAIVQWGSCCACSSADVDWSSSHGREYSSMPRDCLPRLLHRALTPRLGYCPRGCPCPRRPPAADVRIRAAVDGRPSEWSPLRLAAWTVPPVSGGTFWKGRGSYPVFPQMTPLFRPVDAFVLALVVLAVPVYAQTVPPPAQAAMPTERFVSGMVIDAESQAPLAGAEVIVGGATQTTDATGRFRLRLPAGTADVTATAPGYFPLTTSVDVSRGDVQRLELALARDAGFSTSVAVVASAPTAAPAAETVQPVQVLRTPGALDNIYRTLQTLPGVAPTDEFGSRLSVRGGA